MAEGLIFRYERETDILHIDTCPPYATQDSEELEAGVVARLNPETGDVENIEVLFFSTRILHDVLLKLPLTGSLQLASVRPA